MGVPVCNGGLGRRTALQARVGKLYLLRLWITVFFWNRSDPVGGRTRDPGQHGRCTWVQTGEFVYCSGIPSHFGSFDKNSWVTNAALRRLAHDFQPGIERRGIGRKPRMNIGFKQQATIGRCLPFQYTRIGLFLLSWLRLYCSVRNIFAGPVFFFLLFLFLFRDKILKKRTSGLITLLCIIKQPFWGTNSFRIKPKKIDAVLSRGVKVGLQRLNVGEQPTRPTVFQP